MTSMTTFCGVAICAFWAAAAAADPTQFLCVIASPRVTECSGLAASGRDGDVFWTHNDSGDKPRLYAFNRRGEDLGTFEVEGASAVDWEDIASFDLDGRPFLLCADTGDNERRRKTSALYLVEEPIIPETKTPEVRKVPLARRIVFRYEDGPHDCEAVAVDVLDLMIYLMTKERQTPSSSVYALPLSGGEEGTVLTARKIGETPLWPVTAMDISRDGLRAAVLSGLRIVEFRRAPGEAWAAALSRPPREVAVLYPAQWEALAYERDDKALCVSHEGANPTVLRVVLDAPAGP